MAARAGMRTGRVIPARIWRSSLRLRLTAAGTFLTAAIFAVVGPVAIGLYHASLTNSAWTTVTATASEVATQLSSRAVLPDPIPMPVAPGVPRIQVLDSRGRVVTGDPASASAPALFRLPSGQASERAVVSHPAFLAASRAALYAVQAATPQGPETVVAELSLDSADTQASEVAWVTAGLAGVALAVVATVTWLTAGWSLRPVEAAAARQRRFVADAAHELRTPLAGMTAALEVADRHPEASQTLVDDLLAAHRRLGRLVNDLLVLAAVEGPADGRPAQCPPPQAEPVDLAGVVTDCSRRPVPDGISLRLGVLERAFARGDESQLSRVVSNLVDNALRYARGTVELSVRHDGRHAVICVSDDGPGIPAADRERIWERFARLDDARSRASSGSASGGSASSDSASSGSGLGLAMVRELAAAHGGSASVTDARPGPGAVFEVRLPLLPAAAAGGGDPAAASRNRFTARHR
jgi:signal transduction histidine kinase